jgi:glutamine amidotransferase
MIVVDYGVGNLFSVVKALQHVGASVQTSERAEDIASADAVVLPGVGAFADGMKGLAQRGLVEPLRGFAQSGRPLLGLCLGMQLLFEESSEFGLHAGLGLVPGKVVAIAHEPGLKIPHIGWAKLQRSGDTVYFVHSFVAQPSDPSVVSDTVSFGSQQLCAAIAKNNVLGYQFHPEKSGEAGLCMLKAFVTRLGP